MLSPSWIMHSTCTSLVCLISKWWFGICVLIWSVLHLICPGLSDWFEFRWGWIGWLGIFCVLCWLHGKPSSVLLLRCNLLWLVSNLWLWFLGIESSAVDISWLWHCLFLLLYFIWAYEIIKKWMCQTLSGSWSLGRIIGQHSQHEINCLFRGIWNDGAYVCWNEIRKLKSHFKC